MATKNVSHAVFDSDTVERPFALEPILRTPEALKIHCGKWHFKPLDNGVELRVVKDWR